MDNCNNCIFFEARKKQDLYMWMAKTPNGPSVKFEVQSGRCSSDYHVVLMLFCVYSAWLICWCMYAADTQCTRWLRSS